MAQSRVTIAIPTYSRSRTLKRAVDSALGQSYQEIEVMVCDACSTDDTQEVLASYGDRRLRVYRHEFDVGMFANANECVRRASGEYFLYLQDDDYLESRCVEALLDGWGRGKGLVFVYGEHWLHSGSRSLLVRADVGEREDGFEFISGWWEGRRPCFISSVLFRTDMIRSAGGFQPIYALDVYLIHRIALEGAIGHVATPVSHYVDHPQTLSKTRVEWSHVLWDREKLFQMSVEEATRRGRSRVEIARLRRVVRRSQAIVGAGGLLREADKEDSTRRRLLLLAWQLRGILGRRPILSAAALVVAFLPRATRSTVRGVVRKVRGGGHVYE